MHEEKILAAMNTTYAIAKRKPEKKNQACRDSNPDLCDTGAAWFVLNTRERVIVLSIKAWFSLATQAHACACGKHKHKDQNLSFLRDRTYACVASENQAYSSALKFLRRTLRYERL